jgi:hypothetical protein
MNAGGYVLPLEDLAILLINLLHESELLVLYNVNKSHRQLFDKPEVLLNLKQRFKNYPQFSCGKFFMILVKMSIQFRRRYFSDSPENVQIGDRFFLHPSSYLKYETSSLNVNFKVVTTPNKINNTWIMKISPTNVFGIDYNSNLTIEAYYIENERNKHWCAATTKDGPKSVRELRKICRGIKDEGSNNEIDSISSIYLRYKSLPITIYGKPEESAIFVVCEYEDCDLVINCKSYVATYVSQDKKTVIGKMVRDSRHIVYPLGKETIFYYCDDAEHSGKYSKNIWNKEKNYDTGEIEKKILLFGEEKI